MIEQLATLLPAKREKKVEKDMSKITQPFIFFGLDTFKPKKISPTKDESVFRGPTEADGLGVGVAQTRSTTESNFRATLSASGRFKEADTNTGNDPYKFKVVLIQEGLGNLRDAFYYTREAIESGVAEFEGKKCYADHPSRMDEMNRPERSVRDIIGYFEGVKVEDAEDGSAMLVADLVMMKDASNDWARTLVSSSVDYAKKYNEKSLIGLSINASGDAEPVDAEKFLQSGKIPESAKAKMKDAIAQGITTFRLVSVIKDAVSTDLVTEAGARGKVLDIIESNKGETMDKKKMPLPLKGEEKKENEMKQGEMPEAIDQKDHADIDQDKALIADMIKKYMGDNEEMEGEEMEKAHEAYQCYKEMGMENEKAAEATANAIKLAKAMQAKQAEKAEAEVKQAESETEKKEDEAKEGEDETKKESAIVKLTARIAFLEREIKKVDLAKFLDKKLAESKLGRAETDKLRKLIGEPKSEAEITKTIDLFVEGYKASGSESKKVSSPFIESVTKTVSKGTSSKKLDLSDAFK